MQKALDLYLSRRISGASVLLCIIASSTAFVFENGLGGDPLNLYLLRYLSDSIHARNRGLNVMWECDIVNPYIHLQLPGRVAYPKPQVCAPLSTSLYYCAEK